MIERSLRWLCAMLLSIGAARADAPAAVAPPERFAAEIARFVDADRATMPAPGGVVFVGSSSIRLWDTLERDFPDVHVVRRGFGGSTLRDATHYADRIVVPYRPALIVLYGGDNDLHDARLTARQVFDDYVAFVERVRRDRPGQKVAFIAIKPSPARAALVAEARTANDLIRRYVAAHDGLYYVDVFTPMLDADGRPREELFGPDRLHLNAAGYALWRERIAPVLRQALK